MSLDDNRQHVDRPQRAAAFERLIQQSTGYTLYVQAAGGRGDVAVELWQLPRDPIAARLARRQVASTLANLPRDTVEITQLLTSELVANAVEHGEGEIHLSLHHQENAITVAVSDESDAVPTSARPDSTSLDGRGLYLLESLAARWGSTPCATGRGKSVWFVLRAPYRG